MAITNAQLAQQISELLSYWRTRDVQFRDWLTGTADGGPYGDGTYPLTDYLSQTFYVKSPARLQQDVDGLVNSASSYASTAQSAASAAQAAQAAAETARDLAESYRVAALAHLDGAIAARLGAENAAANALGAATNAAASAAAALQSEANAALSESNAAISETNAAASAAAAAASAAAAATFDPDNFAPSAHTHPWNEITNKPATFTPSAHTHSASDITSGTINGNVAINGGLTVNAGGGALSLKPGPHDHVYMQFFADTQNPNSRSAYFGFGGVGTSRLDLVNEMGGDIHVGTSSQIRFNAPSTVVDGTLIINGGPGALSLRRGSQDRTYMTFYDDAVNPNTRSAYFGFGSPDSPHLSIVNEKPGGDIYFATGSQIRFNAPSIAVQGRGGVLHYGDTFTNARVFVRQGGSPVGTQEGDITIIW